MVHMHEQKSGSVHSEQRLREEVETLRSRLAALERANAEEQRIEEQLRRSEAQCRSLISEAPEYIYHLEFRDNRTVSAFHSAQCETLTGYSPSDYERNPYLWYEMVHPDDRERVAAFVRSLRRPGRSASIEHRLVRREGRIRWVLNTCASRFDIATGLLRQTGFLIDITDRKREEEETKRLLAETRNRSLTDDLTGLYNRRGFRMLADQQVRVASRLGQPLLLFFVDVDRLKFVNDTYGHHAGDILIATVADVLRSTFRHSDILARLGGDEFAVLTMEAGANAGQAEPLLTRLNANVDEHNRAAGPYQRVSISVGVSRYPFRRDDSIDLALARADRNMYLRKRQKRIERTSESSGSLPPLGHPKVEGEPWVTLTTGVRGGITRVSR